MLVGTIFQNVFPHQEAGVSLWSQQPLRRSEKVHCAWKMGTGTAQIREAARLELESKATLGGAEGEVGEPGRAGAALHLEKSVAEQGGQEMA